MLKGKLLHPQILDVLGRCGHYSRILIADGNYPYASLSRPEATKVYLNLMPGVPRTTQVLEALLDSLVIQDASVVQVPEGESAAVQDEYARMLGEVPITRLERQAFYDAVCSPMTALVIATAEPRRFANLLLTVGVIKPST